MSGAPDCGNRCPTLYGFDAWCCRPAGHDDQHESADFYWLTDDPWASRKADPWGWSKVLPAVIPETGTAADAGSAP